MNIETQMKKIAERTDYVLRMAASRYIGFNKNVIIRFEEWTHATIAHATIEKGKYVIVYNINYIHDNFDVFIETIIPHEVAHIVQFQHYPDANYHGKEFRQIMRNLGGYNTVAKPEVIRPLGKNQYRYSCMCGTAHVINKVDHDFIEEGYPYYCENCNDVIVLSE